MGFRKSILLATVIFIFSMAGIVPAKAIAGAVPGSGETPGITLPDPVVSDDVLRLLGDNAAIPASETGDRALTLRTENSVALPEPGTVILLVTGVGFLGGYGWWRRRRHDTLPVSMAMVAMPAPDQQTQQARFAEVGQMAGAVMHDVKNALTGIRTCVDVLSYDDLDLEEREEFVQMIAQEIDRLVGMTQEVLDVSSEGSRRFSRQKCVVETLIQDILPMVERDFARRNISVHCKFHYTGEVYVDVNKMKRVFLNIAANARDAMPDGGVFTITSQRVGDTIQFTFTDTGCGMSPELQARFLDPFVTAGKPHGTGLGMAIVKAILDQHQAQLAVQSALGTGTTIRITLPQRI
jgi:signal transduction histidine kinase